MLGSLVNNSMMISEGDLVIKHVKHWVRVWTENKGCKDSKIFNRWWWVRSRIFGLNWSLMKEFSKKSGHDWFQGREVSLLIFLC